MSRSKHLQDQEDLYTDPDDITEIDEYCLDYGDDYFIDNTDSSIFSVSND
jgi:hypothetical protein